jgi:DNA-binding LacI/PurR family transcriptional regulator
LALGALRELTEAGRRVPQDLALIGFDGIRASAHAMPPLSTVRPDFVAAGEIMVDKLLAAIAGEPYEQRRVPVKLLVRESTLKA